MPVVQAIAVPDHEKSDHFERAALVSGEGTTAQVPSAHADIFEKAAGIFAVSSEVLRNICHESHDVQSIVTCYLDHLDVEEGFAAIQAKETADQAEAEAVAAAAGTTYFLQQGEGDWYTNC